jgi:mycolipenoyl-CoA---2-(long-chain-fatty acyl)-trehalose mycolipenoyltransferase / long-chain-acyl-CoA---trehalose acyltransferase
LANVPFDRVLELAADLPNVRKPRPGVPMLSYLEAGVAPLFPNVISQWNALRGRIYSDVGAANQLGMWVNRLGASTTITVAFPDNPVAAQSIGGYLEALKTVCSRVAGRQTGAGQQRATLRAAVN